MSTGRADVAMVDVHLLRLPVRIWARAQEHTDELLREFQLIAQQQHATVHAEIPRRLTSLIEELTAQYANISTEQEAQLAAAAAEEQEEIADLAFRIPADAADASRRLRDMLDQADDYCRAGELLLTLATPPELVRFRTWYLDEFVHQTAGGAPTSWPDYTG